MINVSKRVENMCPVTKGANHKSAPIPEEGKWITAREIKDISGLTHGIGWCAPQQGACKLTLNVKEGVIEEALIEKRYLRENLYLYEPDCSYGFIDMTASGTVFCKRHGSSNLYDNGKITLPSYDVTHEMPLSQKNLDKRNKRVREREIEDFKYDLSVKIRNLLFSPIIGFLLCVALIAAEIIKSKKRESID